MQSAIGSYVHNRKRGFLNHGITFTGQVSPIELPDFNKYKGRIKPVNANLKKIMEEYNAIQNPKNLKSDSEHQTRAQEAQDTITKMIREKYGVEKISGIDWSNSTVLIDKDYEQGLNVSSLSRTTKDGHRVLLASEAIKKLIKIRNNMDENLLTVIQREKGNPEETINQIGKDIDRYIEEAIFLEELYAEEIPPELKRKERKIKESIRRSMTNLQNDINETIAKFNKTPPKSLWDGTLFEYATALLPYVAGKTGYKTIQQYLEKEFKNTYVGNKSTTIAIESAKGAILSPPAFSKTIQKITFTVNGDLKRGQGKVDVEFKWDGEDLKFSNKNYTIDSPKTEIHIVNGTPLLTLLLGLNENFVNYFLNYATQHEDDKGESGSILKDGELKSLGLPSREEMYKYMKQILFYEGLTGDIFQEENGDVVNVFFLNDKITGDIKIVSVSDIVNKIETKIDKIRVIAGNRQFNSNWILPNAYVGDRGETSWTGAAARISNLITQIHAAKITAGFQVQDMLL